jgi:hypothetical protein
MCWGDEPPQMQQIPNPPPEKEMMDFINYLTGTQTVTVTDANGKRQRVTTKLPKPPDEQRGVDFARNLFNTSMEDVLRLFRYDPRSAISYAPLINAINNTSEQNLQDIGQFANLNDLQEKRQQLQTMQRALVDEQFARDRMAQEERLAHSGRGSGTYAAESRAAMARAQGLARAEGDAKASAMAEDLVAKRLGTDTNAFGVRAAGRQGMVDAARADYALNKEDERDQEARRIQAINERRGQFDIGSNVLKYEDSKSLQDRTQQDALGMYQAENNVQNARYGQQVNAINANNRAAMDEYNSRGPSFGEWALGTAGKIGGSIWNASDDSMAGRAGKKISGAFGF